MRMSRPPSRAGVAGLRRAVLPALVTVLVGIGVGACGGDPPPLPPEIAEDRRPELLILVYDRSNSISEHSLTHYKEATRGRLDDLVHGDRIVALKVLERSLDEEPVRWAQEVPEREVQHRAMPRDSVTRARFVQDARDYLSRFTNSDRPAATGTDILSTLHLVAAEVAAYPEHRPILILFSDMLQANEVMNMEGLVRMPPAGWVEEQARTGTLPDLSDVCVVVVGARVDTRASQRVQSFWEEYFEATGATLLDRNYQYRSVRVPERPCG
jgi:hypothetical protein